MGKTILVTGLGRFINVDPNAVAKVGPLADAKQGVIDSLAQAKEAGFDCHSIDINPDDPKATLAAFEEKLNAQHFDGITIGYGVRGNKDFTALFEDLVNMAISLNPGVRFGFSIAPGAVWATIQRIFPEGSG